jgi:hypothetical protein
MMYAKKVANIMKAVKEYMPEHGTSIAKCMGWPDEVATAIVGGP